MLPPSAPPAVSGLTASSAPTAIAVAMSRSRSLSVGSFNRPSDPPPPGHCLRPPPRRRARPRGRPETTFTPRWSGCRNGSSASRPHLPNVISPMAHWCFAIPLRAARSDAAVCSPAATGAMVAANAADRLWRACSRNGCPLAIAVLDGNTFDRIALAIQVDMLKQRFNLDRVDLSGGKRGTGRRGAWTLLFVSLRPVRRAIGKAVNPMPHRAV